MILIQSASLDARLADLLRDPYRYYADARARAWRAASAEVDADLAERAEQRLSPTKNQSAHWHIWR
ncbi:MAG TPA: hypothetical protein VFU35_02740 [Jatrophihabitans sp.]|nr:hypothetical protein [Jatrophihabitans sp.]